MSGWGVLEVVSALIVLGTAVFLIVVAYDFGDDFARSDRAAAKREARAAARAHGATVPGATRGPRRPRTATTAPDRDPARDRDRDRGPKAQV